MMLRFSDCFHAGRLLVWAGLAILVTGCFDLARSQQPGQKTFASSEAACAALVAAVQQEGQAALVEILGPAGKEIISGGDEIEDRNNRRRFVEKYQQMHRLVREPNGTITLYVGAENWPLPILLVHKGNQWYFDPVASKAEILFRRIGRNELETIAICRELVNNRNESPTAERVALVTSGDYASETTSTRPSHGYYFRVLNRQGSDARGGAKSLALVAYPAEYRSSGVMTFIVNRDGIVYQKDLGPRTAIRARALTHYDSRMNWKKVE